MKIYILLYFLLLASLLGAQPCPATQSTKVIIINEPADYDPPIILAEPNRLPGPLTNTDHEEDRVIGFVHGLGGNSDGWVPVADDIDERYRTKQVRPTYTERYNLSVAGEDLHVQMGVWANEYNEDYEIDPKHNFIIGHSQGGLVARAAYQNYLEDQVPVEFRNFGGIVTVCTAHNGAEFLNIVKPSPDYPNGETPAGLFAEEAFNALKAGPVEELIHTNVPSFLINWFNIDEAAQQFAEQLSNIVTTDILPIAFGGNNEPITEAYTPGAQQITDMNAFGDLGIPSVAFWAKEADPLIWRSVFWFTKEPSTLGPYGATDELEQAFIDDKVNVNIELYRMKMEAFEILQDNVCTSSQWFWHPNICANQADNYHDAFYDLNVFIDNNVTTDPSGNASSQDSQGNTFNSNEAGQISRAYRRGYEWFLGADDLYKDLVGALETEPTYACECEVEYQNGDITYFSQAVSTPSCDDIINSDPYINGCDLIVSGLNILSEEASDGSVVKSSALAFPGATQNDANIIDNAFHMQARNHPNLKVQLDKLLEGKIDELDYFKTALHQ